MCGTGREEPYSSRSRHSMTNTAITGVPLEIRGSTEGLSKRQKKGSSVATPYNEHASQGCSG